MLKDTFLFKGFAMDADISDFPQGSRFPAVSGKRPVPVLNLLTPGRYTEFLYFYREKVNDKAGWGKSPLIPLCERGNDDD